MKILVDGDSCPVLDIIENFARHHDLELLIFSEVKDELTTKYGRPIVIDQLNQSINKEILSHTEPDDLVITRNYELARMVINIEATAISQEGLIYTEDNIEKLLNQRRALARERKSESGNDKPLTRQRQQERTWKDDVRFHQALEKVYEKNLSTKYRGGNS